MVESAKIRFAIALQVGLVKDVKQRHVLTIAGIMAHVMILAHATVHQDTEAHLAISDMSNMASVTNILKFANAMQ